jgi:hypothetical protein
MDVLSSIIDAGLTGAAAASVLGMGLWMVLQNSIPSEALSDRPASTPGTAAPPLRQAA